MGKLPIYEASVTQTRPDSPLASAFDRILRPLVRLAIARGLRFQDLTERLRAAYIRAAERHWAPSGKRISDSRISALTGLQRKDIKAARARETVDAPPLAGPLPRLIHTWRTDPEFVGPDGEPAILPRSGAGQSFDALAARVSTDIHSRSILDELLRLDLAQETQDGIALLADAFVPGQDEAAALGYLGGNLGDHMSAAVENVLAEDRPPHFERAAHFNHLTPQALTELDALARKLQQETLEKIAARAATLQRANRNDPAATGRFRCGAYVRCVKIEETGE